MTAIPYSPAGLHFIIVINFFFGQCTCGLNLTSAVFGNSCRSVFDQYDPAQRNPEEDGVFSLPRISRIGRNRVATLVFLQRQRH
jgi:hypothetical protein